MWIGKITCTSGTDYFLVTCTENNVTTEKLVQPPPPLPSPPQPLPSNSVTCTPVKKISAVSRILET